MASIVRLVSVAVMGLCGCADQFLDHEVDRVLDSGRLELQPASSGGAGDLGDAADTATKLAGAYFRAARASSTAQDAASAGIVVAAASVVSGSVGTASDRALANRAMTGVTLQQAAARGVPKSSIQGIYKGARTLNCISAVATIYSAVDSDVRDSPLAVELTYAAIREVRINTRNAMARDPASFSSLVRIYEDALPGAGGAPLTAAERGGARMGALETYLRRLAGCLENPALEKNTKGQ